MVLAAGFGACGLALPMIKTSMLGGQAKRFSRDFLEVVAKDDLKFALELQKFYAFRLPPSVSLDEHYRLNDGAASRLTKFRAEPVTGTIQRSGTDANWAVAQVRIFFSRGRERADVMWRSPTGDRIRFIMDYVKDEDGHGQWHTPNVHVHRERLVAENIL